MSGRIVISFLFLRGVLWGASGELVLATYNIENYGPADRMTENGYRQAYPKPEKEKAALRRVIIALQADVLFLEEMGPRPYLEELQSDLRRAGLAYTEARLLEAADKDRHLAVLARVSLRNFRAHTDLKFKYFGAMEIVKRGLLEVSFRAPGGEITCFAVHLKSKFTERPDDPLSEIRRAGEAEAVREQILREFPRPSEARVILLGDLNDGKTSRALLRLGQKGNTPLLFLVPGKDARGEVWTHNYAKEEVYSSLDHIFVSAALNPEIAGAYAAIGSGVDVDFASDHRPVSIKLIQPSRSQLPQVGRAISPLP